MNPTKLLSRIKKQKGCWIWQGGIQSKGYGSVQYLGKTWLTHRVAWILAHGPIPTGAMVLHRCDRPPCVNPKHLFSGNARINYYDSKKKGRDAHGEKTGMGRLTEKKVETIHKLRRKGYFAWEIALLLRVGKTTVGSVLRGTSWKHIPAEARRVR